MMNIDKFITYWNYNLALALGNYILAIIEEAINEERIKEGMTALEV